MFDRVEAMDEIDELGMVVSFNLHRQLGDDGRRPPPKPQTWLGQIRVDLIPKVQNRLLIPSRQLAKRGKGPFVINFAFF